MKLKKHKGKVLVHDEKVAQAILQATHQKMQDDLNAFHERYAQALSVPCFIRPGR